MTNIPDINFNKIPNKNVKFNQTEYYENNFEKINEQIVPKVNELDAQLAETGNRIDNIIVTPAEGITEQEILDARQGKGSLGANITEVKTNLKGVAKLIGTSFEFKGQAFAKIQPHNGWAYSKYKWDDSTKEIVSLSFEGSGHGSWDGIIYFRRKPKYSDDFSAPIEVENLRASGIGCTCQAFEIAANGDYVALISRVQTSTATDLGTWIYRSTDKGVTWVVENQLIVDGVTIIAITGDVTNLFRLSTGRLLSWGWFVNPYKQIFTLYSDDNGHTFHFGSVAGSTTAFEPAFCELSDGSVVALLRNNLGGTTKTPALYTKSVDGGITWSEPIPSTTILDMTDNNGVFIRRPNSNIIEFVNCSRLVQADGHKSIYQSVFTDEDAKTGNFGVQTRMLRIDGSADFGYPAALLTDDDVVHLFFYTGTFSNATICYMTGTNKTTYLNQPENFDYLFGVKTTEASQEIIIGMVPAYASAYEQGAFNGGVTGVADVTLVSAARVRLKDFVEFSPSVNYFLQLNKAAYQVVVRQYNSSFVCIADSAWQQDYRFTTLSNCAYVKVVVRKMYDSPITPNDIVSNLFTIQRVISSPVSVSENQFLYEEGTEKVTLTGGWIAGYSTGVGTQAKLARSLHITASSSGSDASKRSYLPDNGVDVTNLSALKAFVKINSLTGNADMALPLYTKKVPADVLDGRLNYTKTQIIGYSTIVVDVSALSGIVYPMITASCPVVASTIDGEVFAIWGEA